jgi:hypothetical protein
MDRAYGSENVAAPNHFLFADIYKKIGQGEMGGSRPGSHRHPHSCRNEGAVTAPVNFFKEGNP